MNNNNSDNDSTPPAPLHKYSWGGKRTGSGPKRKNPDTLRVRLTVRVNPESMRWLREFREQFSPTLSFSRAIDILVHRVKTQNKIE